MRVVVGLDGTPYADAATRVACCLATPVSATVVGVAVVDQPGIEASSHGAGVGAYAYARMIREQRFADSSKKAAAFLETFDGYCREVGAECELANRAGVPFQCILDEGRYADLIVVGSRTHFHYETRESSGDTLRRLMEVCACPVLAVPQEATGCPRHAIVANDGSFEAARAMRAFVALTACAKNPPSVTLVHVGEGSDEDGQVQLETARRYVASYGLDVEIERRQGNPSEQIEAAALAHEDCMIVMGAYGRRGVIGKIFFGSTAAAIVEHQRVPLFVYH